jgi:hypothetical protein
MKVNLLVVLGFNSYGWHATKELTVGFTPSTEIEFSLPGLGERKPVHIGYDEDSDSLTVSFGIIELHSEEERKNTGDSLEQFGWKVMGR